MRAEAKERAIRLFKMLSLVVTTTAMGSAVVTILLLLGLRWTLGRLVDYVCEPATPMFVNFFAAGAWFISASTQERLLDASPSPVVQFLNHWAAHSNTIAALATGCAILLTLFASFVKDWRRMQRIKERQEERRIDGALRRLEKERG